MQTLASGALDVYIACQSEGCITYLVLAPTLCLSTEQKARSWRIGHSKPDQLVCWEECRFGMREALAIASAEGLESMWARHRALHLHLWEGLREMGLEPFVEKEQYRLVSVNTIKVRLAHAKP